MELGSVFYSWVFGIANHAYLSLLVFVPLLNIIWTFVTGFKGAEWAWSSGHFDTPEEFNAVMRSWNRGGIASAIFSVAVAIIIAIFALLYSVLMVGLIGSMADLNQLSIQ